MKATFVLVASALCVGAIAQSFGDFHANDSVEANTTFVVNAADRVIKTNKTSAATFPMNAATTNASVSIYALWPDALFYEANMNVDCDGPDFQCQGNADGQDATTWGNLSAFDTPYIVMPDSFVSANGVPQNALAAVICNNVTYYGILGDTNGATPEVIGEASWLMAQTCFPDEDLNGAIGHSTPDVLCNTPLRLVYLFDANGSQDIVFLSGFFDVNETTITNYTALSQQGDQKMTQLIDWLISTNATSTSAKSGANSFTGKHNTTLVVNLLFVVSAVIFLI